MTKVMPAGYADWDAHNLLGMPMPGTGTESPGVAPGLASSAHPGAFSTTAPLWSPKNPLFWFAAVLAVTGLAAFSTELRVGPFKGAVGVGK